MTKKDAAKLLELIQLSYPTSYRDKDDGFKLATIQMWYRSFEDVPYPIVEQAFNHYRMTNKFPPTVAEIVEELRVVYYEALEKASVHSTLGNKELVSCYREIMSYTERYAKGNVGGLNIDNLLPMLNGGDGYERFGTPRNNLRSEDRLPLLDAGGGYPGI